MTPFHAVYGLIRGISAFFLWNVCFLCLPYTNAIFGFGNQSGNAIALQILVFQLCGYFFVGLFLRFSAATLTSLVFRQAFFEGSGISRQLRTSPQIKGLAGICNGLLIACFGIISLATGATFLLSSFEFLISPNSPYRQTLLRAITESTSLMAPFIQMAFGIALIFYYSSARFKDENNRAG